MSGPNAMKIRFKMAEIGNTLKSVTFKIFYQVLIAKKWCFIDMVIIINQ